MQAEAGRGWPRTAARVRALETLTGGPKWPYCVDLSRAWQRAPLRRHQAADVVPVEAHGRPPLVHRTADYRGVTLPILRDGAALSGLLLSAASAAGLSTAEPPTVRTLPRDGLAVLLLLDLGHVTVHTIPARDTLLLDLLVPAGRDPQKAVDVFTRKLGARESRSGRWDRG